jgi:hypothetical protein
MKARVLTAALVLGGLAAGWAIALPAHGAEISAERQREMVRRGLDAFDEAVRVAQQQPAAAQELYREARSTFAALRDAGVRNAALEYNLGNTHFRLGDLGRAIVHYRRAERLEPANARVRENLEYARRQVEPLIEPAGQARLWRDLAFVHYRTSAHGRARAAAVLTILGWLLLIVRLRWPARSLAVAGVISVLLGLSLAGSVAWEVREEGRWPPAVVVGEPVVLRLGWGDGSDPALKQPLGPGVELWVLHERGGWVEVRLSNNQTGWLPAAAVERV